MGKRHISRMLELMNKRWIWVAVENKRQVGFITARVEPPVLHLIWLDVHPDFQRKGVGTALLHQVMEAGKSYGLGPLVCEVWDQNEKALGFYDKHGFRRYRWYEDYYKNDLSAWQLLKDL